MARLFVAPEHKKFFQIKGWITFAPFFSVTEKSQLFERILPGQQRLENFFHAYPRLAKKSGAVAATLLDRKPVRLSYDCVISHINEIPPIQEREIGLLLSSSGQGHFFTEPSSLYNQKEECYILVIFTANYNNTPIVFQ